MFFEFFVFINPKFQKEKYFLKATLEVGNVHYIHDKFQGYIYKIDWEMVVV